jgi:hypothetical protein
MAGRWASRRASLRFVAPRLAAGLALVVGVSFVVANPAAAAGPSAPAITALVAGPGVGVMSLRWSVPKFPGGAQITGYEYRVQVDGGSFSLPAPLAGATSTRATAPCLAPPEPGHGCTYQVRATNGTPGAWSVSVAATWLPPSFAVLGKSVGGPDADTATLLWRVPKTSGGLEISYQYMVDAGSGFTGPFTIDPNTITVASAFRFTVLTAAVPCAPTGPTLACSYILTAVNAAGASVPSKTRVAAFRHPGPPTALQVFTSSVALGSGLATQEVSWDPPTNVGGSALTDYIGQACATFSGSLCLNTSGGWTQFADLTGSPPPTNTTHDCPANGRCAYEIWAKNQLGKGWVFGYAGSGGPTNLSGTTAPGQVDLQWLNPIDTGNFGHYTLFECDSTQVCSNGNWTSVPADAAPWTSVDLSGTATNTSFVCGVGVHCMFRVGYVDADGNIGGVSNAVTLTGQ